MGTGVAIWDPLLGIRLGGIRRPNVFIGEPEVTADGRHVRQGGRLWELATGAPAAWTSPADTIYAVGIAGRSPPADSGSGAIAAETPSGDSIQVIEYGTGRVLLLAPFDVPAANTVTLSDDGSRLATQWTDYSGEDPRNWISVWEVGTGQELTRIPLEDDVSYGMWHLRLSPDGAFLSAAFDDAMQVWEAETGREAGEFDAPGISGPRGRVVFSPGGTYLSYRPAFAGAEDSIWVRRTGTWDVVARFDRAGGIRFSPDERFAFGWDHGRSELIELETGEKRWTGAEIRAVSPDGEMAVVGSELWSLETFTSLATLSDGSYQVWAATFSPDGHLLITAGDDGATRVWDPHGPVELFRRFATTGGDWAVASEDGRFDGSEIGVRGLYYLRGDRAVGVDVLGRDLFQPGLSGLLIGDAVGGRGEARSGQVGPATIAESGTAGRRVTALTRALESARAAGDASAEAEALQGLGTTFLELERPTIALLYLTRARDLATELSDPDGLSRAESLLGDARLSLGRSEAAVESYRAALDRTAESDGERRLALTLDLGGALLAAGRSGAALAHMHEAAGGREARGDSAELARAWIEIAGAHRLLGRADSAKAYYRRGATLHRDQGRPEELAAALTDWAELKVETESDVADSLGTAAAFYRYAARVHRESGNLEREASALSGLGWTLTRWSDLERARNAFRAQSLAFAADDTLKRAFSIQIARGDERGLATTVGRLAALLSTGQPVSCLLPSPIGCPRDNVLGPHRWATELFRRESDHWGEFNALWDLGRAFGSQRNYRGAVTSYAAASEALTGLRHGAGGDADRVSFVERASGLIGSWTDAWRWLALTVGERGAALGLLAASEAGRARALLDLLGAAPSQRSSPEEPPVAPSVSAQIATGDSLSRAAAELGVPVVTYSVSPDMVSALLIGPDGPVRPFAKAVSRDSLSALVESLRVGLGVDAAAREVLLATGDRTLDPGLSRRPEEDRLRSEEVGGETRSEEVGSETVGAGEAWRDVESALSEILLDPAILDAIPAGGEVVIVPHGVLNLVPFALLTPPGAERPLGLTHALRYAPSIRAMLASEGSGEVLDPRRLDRERLLVVGDPIMPGVYSSLGERLELDRLPGAAAEAESVSELLGTGYLTDGMASEAAVRGRIAEASLVHLATHGYAYSSEAQARESFVALAPGEGEDGVLTLAEVMEGPDLAAELVVLSACQTGLGNLRQAEGTVGFQRAFLARKARSVLVSQWNVSDEATRILMERFYAHWTADRDEPGKAEALRRAQLDLFESGYEHPRFWAAFQLVGAR